MAPLLAAALTAAITTALLAVLVPVLRRRGVIDVPGDRSSHDVPTPRGGGAAIAVGVAIGYAAAGGGFWAALALGLAAGAVGLVDDVRSLSATTRLAAQALIVVVSVPFLIAAMDSAAGWVVAFGVVVAVGAVGFINAFNFMDGINGISASQLLVAGAAWWIAGAVEASDALEAAGAVTVAAAIAFAPWNFPRARVFLGDVGSYFAGAWLAGVSVMATVAGVPLEATAAPLLLYVADTGFTLITRVRRGERWSAPHRDHVYQTLLRNGWSHVRTTATVTGFLVVSAAGGLLALTGSWTWRLLGWAAVAAALTAYLALPRAMVRESQVAAR